MKAKRKVSLKFRSHSYSKLFRHSMVLIWDRVMIICPKKEKKTTRKKRYNLIVSLRSDCFLHVYAFAYLFDSILYFWCESHLKCRTSIEPTNESVYAAFMAHKSKDNH